MPYIGPDTVDLVIRTPTGDLDAEATPVYSERVVSKGNSNVSVADGWGSAADTSAGSTQEYSAKAALPVDEDTRALTGEDAFVYQGILYELNRGSDIKLTLRGAEDHVRVFGHAVINTDRSAEQVVITPNLGRDDSGQPRGNGQPYSVMAHAVTAGNTLETFGISGNTDLADFTVAFPISVPIRDNDWVQVRGRTGYARVRTELDRWQGRQLKLVTVHSASGGTAR